MNYKTTPESHARWNVEIGMGLACLRVHVVRRHVSLRCGCMEQKTEIENIASRFLSCCSKQMESGNKTAIPHVQKLHIEFWDWLSPEEDQICQFK